MMLMLLYYAFLVAGWKLASYGQFDQDLDDQYHFQG